MAYSCCNEWSHTYLLILTESHSLPLSLFILYCVGFDRCAKACLLYCCLIPRNFTTGKLLMVHLFIPFFDLSTCDLLLSPLIIFPYGSCLYLLRLQPWSPRHTQPCLGFNGRWPFKLWSSFLCSEHLATEHLLTLTPSFWQEQMFLKSCARTYWDASVGKDNYQDRWPEFSARTHTAERETQLLQTASWLLHILASVCAHMWITHTYTHTLKYSNFLKLILGIVGGLAMLPLLTPFHLASCYISICYNLLIVCFIQLWR